MYTAVSANKHAEHFPLMVIHFDSLFKSLSNFYPHYQGTNKIPNFNKVQFINNLKSFNSIEMLKLGIGWR